MANTFWNEMLSNIMLVYACMYLSIVFSAKITMQAKRKRKECIGTIGMRGMRKASHRISTFAQEETSELVFPQMFSFPPL